MMGGKRGRPKGPLVSLHERLERRKRVDPLRGCWEWTGYLDPNGYGRITMAGRSDYVHRVSWELETGKPVPDGLTIDHLCENRRCFNPAHLEVVTYRENTNRRKNSQASRTHCPRGHRYAGQNLRVYVNKQGQKRRYCIACNKIRSAEYRTRLAGDVA